MDQCWWGIVNKNASAFWYWRMNKHDVQNQTTPNLWAHDSPPVPPSIPFPFLFFFAGQGWARWCVGDRVAWLPATAGLAINGLTMFFPTLWAPADWHGMAQGNETWPWSILRNAWFVLLLSWCVGCGKQWQRLNSQVSNRLFCLLFVAYIFCPNDTRDREEVGIDSSGNAVVIKRRQRRQCWLICEKPLA